MAASQQARIITMLSVFGVLFVIVFFALTFVVDNDSNDDGARLRTNTHGQCQLEGPESIAPNNYKEYKVNLDKAIEFIKNQGHDKVVFTTANLDAMTYNSDNFLAGITFTSPPMKHYTIINCLDDEACSMCRAKHLPELCVYMDFHVGKKFISPLGKGDAMNDNYFRLTFGRFYAAYHILLNYQMNVLAVDIDSVFFQNPFAEGQMLNNHPYISVVIAAENFDITDAEEGGMINGGLIYFPAVNAWSWQDSKEVIRRFWSLNCYSRVKNDQEVFSDMLRFYYQEQHAASPQLKLVNPNDDTANNKKRRNPKKQPKDEYFSPLTKAPRSDYQVTVLPTTQYMNFCNNICGNRAKFMSSYTLESLHDFEKNAILQLSQTDHDIGSYKCTTKHRKEWVFFHMVCIGSSLDDLTSSERKSRYQRAILEWVREAQLTVASEEEHNKAGAGAGVGMQRLEQEGHGQRVVTEEEGHREADAAIAHEEGEKKEE